MKLWPPRDIAAVMLIVTLCFMLVALVVNAMLHPDNVTDKSREFIYYLITALIGFASGWILGKGTDQPKPPELK